MPVGHLVDPRRNLRRSKPDPMAPEDGLDVADRDAHVNVRVEARLEVSSRGPDAKKPSEGGIHDI
jgi:hypothetical protein